MKLWKNETKSLPEVLAQEIFVSNRFAILHIFYKQYSQGIVLKVVYDFE